MKCMEEKHNREALETQIKNLQAELKHLNSEYEYCRQVATDSSLKLAMICSDYENNQLSLMKRNRSVLEYTKKIYAMLTNIDQTVNSEKIKSSNLAATLKDFKELPSLL